MHSIINLNYSTESPEATGFVTDTVQNIGRVLLEPIIYKPSIQEALQRVNFQFHRTCSYSNLIRECHVAEGQTLLIFWGSRTSDSRVTVSMSASSCSSLQTPQNQSSNICDRALRSIAQQTDISCRYSSGIGSPTSLTESEEQRLMRSRIADSLTVSSPASSLIQPTRHSISILGSVCALLLKKQTSIEKEITSVTESHHSDNICRICFGGESAERLVRPCSCRGTIAAVHRTCLERWLLQAATSYCELCRHHYVVTRSHKWSWVRSVAEWARAGRGRALAGDAWRGVALGAASALGTARALHACDVALQAGARRGGAAALAANVFSSLLIGIVGALNGLLTTWMLLKIQEHQNAWREWRDSTMHVHVALGTPPPSPALSTSDSLAHSSPPSPAPSPAASITTVVGASRTSDRATNIADPFMVALPFYFPES